MIQGTQQQAQPVLVGTSLPRPDGPDKVTGRARYTGDQALPGMLYARLVTSPYAHARILTIDTSAALSVPGVVAVFTAETLGIAQADPLSRSQSPLAQQEVWWCGHPVAVVVGETEAQDGKGRPVVVDRGEHLLASLHQPDRHRPARADLGGVDRARGGAAGWRALLGGAPRSRRRNRLDRAVSRREPLTGGRAPLRCVHR